jgi:lysozyme
MNPSNNCLELILKFEGLKLVPYLCPAKIPTIGVGATMYENGVKVKLTDPPITKERALQLLSFDLIKFGEYVDRYTKEINQNQFDALTSFCYNLGPTNYKNSTLLKKINANPNDKTIRDEFLKWTKANGKTLLGLVKRREAEANLYEKPIKIQSHTRTT